MDAERKEWIQNYVLSDQFSDKLKLHCDKTSEGSSRMKLDHPAFDSSCQAVLLACIKQRSTKPRGPVTLTGLRPEIPRGVTVGMVCHEAVTGGLFPYPHKLPPSTVFHGGGGIKQTRFFCQEDLQKERLLIPKLFLGDIGTQNNHEVSAFKIMATPSADLYTNDLQKPESVFGVKLSVLSEDEPARTRIPTRNWSAEEILAMLELMEEALRVVEGPDIWDCVSKSLWKLSPFDRASNTCEKMWGALLRSYRAVRDHPSKIRASTTFDRECGEKIESILASRPLGCLQVNADLPSTALPLCLFQSSGSAMRHHPTDSGHCDKVLDDELTDTEIKEIGTRSHVASCYKTDSNFSDRKSSGATFDEDHALISRIAPLVTKQIEDALKPLVSVLRSRDEHERNEQKRRERSLALEEEKLALKREKMQFTHRVLANSNAFRPNRPRA